MIRIPEEQIISKIKDATGITDNELESKIKIKMDQLAGLISREGALHIIANEYNLKLMDMPEGKLKIKNLLTGMRNVEVLGKVIDVYEAREFQSGNRSGKVGSFMIGDETATVRIVLWGSKADELMNMKKGDIVNIQSAYVKDNQGRQEVHLNDKATLTINPEGESIGKIKQTVNQRSYNRKNIKDLQDDESDIEILGTIVQAFNPNFFEVCPECGKRTKPEEGNYNCPEHGQITPAFSYVMNALIDDGTGNLRGTFFRNQANMLTGKTYEEFIAYKDEPEKFEEVKRDMLGKIVKIAGKVKKNMMFDRLEFNTQLVFANPDPERELKRLRGEEVEPEELTISQNNTMYTESKAPVKEPETEEPKEGVVEQPQPKEEEPVIEVVEAHTEPIVQELPVEEPAEEPEDTEEKTESIEEVEKKLESEIDQPAITEENNIDEDLLKLDDIKPIEETAIDDPDDQDLTRGSDEEL